MCAQRLSVDCMRGLLDHPISGLRHGGSLVHPPLSCSATNCFCSMASTRECFPPRPY